MAFTFLGIYSLRCILKRLFVLVALAEQMMVNPFVLFFYATFCIYSTSTQNESNRRFSILVPGCSVGCDFEATGVANEFVKDADNLVKLGTVIPLLLPAVQHQLIECGRAVHGWWQAITLIYSFYYLQAEIN